MAEAIVECPMCGETIKIIGYDAVSRSDAIVKHLNEECKINLLPTLPTVGPPLPKALGIRWPWRGR